MPLFPLPPAPMPAVALGPPPRLRKAWRYAGVFGPEIMLCAAVVRVGPGRQAFWAVWDRRTRRLRERTRLLPRRQVVLTPGRVEVRDGPVEIVLRLDAAGAAVAVTSDHAGAPIWTRKQPVRARGTLRIDGLASPIDAPGLLDDSAGWHAHRTSWRWTAGVGAAPDGRALAWNLVEGLHDGPSGSERRVWIDGRAQEVGPVAFGAGLERVGFAEGGELAFLPETVRARRDSLLGVVSDYEQPFGRFSGTLPGGVQVLGGLGVMERHSARW